MSIGTKIFISIASCYLKISITTCNHKELLIKLRTLWESIKDANSRISKLEVIKGFWDNIDLKWILMLVGVLAGITLIITMISNKVKSAKMTKVPKVKKEKKKEEDVPSI